MIEDLFLNTAPALSAIFQLGFEPKEEYFYALTEEQYEYLGIERKDEIWYMLLPKEYNYQTYETIIVTEYQKNSLFKAAQIIENYCRNSEKTFINYKDKLKYVANLLPPVFTCDSKFKQRYLKLAK